MAKAMPKMEVSGAEKPCIEMKSLSWLQPYEKNPRKNDSAVQAVAESIKQFGFLVPIVATAEGVILAGHTRYKASAQLELAEVPVLIAKDLDEAKQRAFRLVDNKVGEMAGWDFDLLNVELEELQELDLEVFGFSSESFNADRFFEDAGEEGEEKQEKKKTAICPHCGKEFEL